MRFSHQLVKCSKTKAARGLAVFFAGVLLSSALLVHYMGKLTEVAGNHFISIYIWSVAGASVAARLLLRESPRDISFRWYGWMTSRAMLVGTALPLAVGLIAYGIGWSTGLAHFAAPQIPQAVFGFSIAGSYAQRSCKYLLVSLTLGGLWSCRLSAGEEIGWRGYMLTRLMDSGLPSPIWMSGVIWGLWHIPLILYGEYTVVPNSILSISVFVIDITALGYIFAWLRLSSGSIWPCVWAHSVWNQVFLGPFGGSHDGGGIWVGEAGLLTTLVVILLAVALYRFLPLRPQVPGGMARHDL
jgi:membrane protease YdiL (CAAX protease family)